MSVLQKDLARYRHHLSQLSRDLFLTDGGIETTLIFHEGLRLPYFAAFDLLKDAFGYAALHKYFRTYAQIARRYGTNLILESPTWRASLDWGMKLGYSVDKLADLNRAAIALLTDIRDTYETETSRFLISGCIGPRGDGYSPGEQLMTVAEAQKYHAFQVNTFQDTQADLITGMTLTNIPEAIGLTRAAQAVAMPVAIAFTVETNGCLPTGESLKQAIEQVDAATRKGPAYYMINCAHPTHFATVLTTGEPWLARIRGIRANASRKSHAELDESETLDAGDPLELASECSALRAKLPNLNIIGGCCGTDHRHIAAMGNMFIT